MDMFYKHYIEVDTENRIISGWSDGIQPDKDASDAICINDLGGYQFRLRHDGEENTALYTTDFIPRWKFEDGKPVLRSEEEIAADRAVRDKKTPAEQREAAYNSDAVIEWGGEALTVTQAAQQWAYYAAEGDAEKTAALIDLIAAAKQSIRTAYPDEDEG